MSRLIAGFFVAACLLGPAGAGEVADKAVQAEALADDGEFIRALSLLDEAAEQLWERSPLAFRRALWVAGPPIGFGAYNPREDNAYSAGDEMIVYAEPVGFGWRKSGDLWQTEFAADLTVRDAEGEVLYEQKDFRKLEVSSRVRNREFMATFTYTLSGIPAGEYTIETTLRDAVTGKSGSVTLPFIIR
jgi:hypothetical protein